LPIIASFTYIYISQGSVATQLTGDGILITALLQIFHKMCWWKNFENRSIFRKDMNNSWRLNFFAPPPVCTLLMTCDHYDNRQTFRNEPDSQMWKTKNYNMGFLKKCTFYDAYITSWCLTYI